VQTKHPQSYFGYWSGWTQGSCLDVGFIQSDLRVASGITIRAEIFTFILHTHSLTQRVVKI
jgi:hypothetical protein